LLAEFIIVLAGLHEGGVAAVSGTTVCAAQMGINFNQFNGPVLL